MADIRSFFGGAPKKKPADGDAAAPAAAAAAAAAPAKKAAAKGDAAAADSKPKKKAAASTDSEKKPKKPSKKAASEESGVGALVIEPKKASKSSPKPKAKPAAAASESKSADEVKSPHFSSASASKPSAAAAAASSADAKKNKKRIRDEDEEIEEIDDDDDVQIMEDVGPPKAKKDAVVAPASPAKATVYRTEQSPVRKEKVAVGATDVVSFFAASVAPAKKELTAAEKLAPKVQKAQQDERRRKLEAEAKAMQEAIDAVNRADEQEALDQIAAAEVAARAESAELAAATAPSVVISAPSPPPDAMEEDEEVSEIARPPPKSPLRSPPPTALAKSPAMTPKKASPAPSAAASSASPLRSPLFVPFQPSEQPRASLKASTGPLPVPSPRKPSPSPQPPKSPARPAVAAAAPKSPAPKPAASKPTAAKRAHALISADESQDTQAVSQATASQATLPASMADDDGFGGASLLSAYDAFEGADVVAEDDAPSSAAKKQKNNAGAAVASGEKEKKKWAGPYKPPPPSALLGTKEVPIGKPNCLAGLTFVLTGVGESLSREDTADLVKKYGAKCTTSLSKKTDYLVAGAEAGESKLSKAKELKTKIIDEDALLQMIRDKSKGWAPPGGAAAASAAASAPPPPKLFIQPAGVSLAKPLATVALAPKGSAAELAIMRSGTQTATSISDMLWVDAHRPMKVEAIIGNPGLIKQITEWLSTWHAKRKHREQTQTAKQQEKATGKAMLISGPPGIGKSTAAGVIARSLGFEVIEFNASDVRNKKSLEHVVGDITGNRGMQEFLKGPGGSSSAAAASASASSKVGHKQSVIIMDEVDGMDGNGDRGGMQELVALIKKTRTPIICIANDAGTPKMKTLKGYTEAITWRRVPASIIAPKIIEICRKEGLDIDKQSVEKLAESTQGDIRQILNFLQMTRKASKNVSFDEVKQRIAGSGKDFSLGPFDVVPDLFKPVPPSAPGRPNDWIGDRQNLYFVDSMIIPLFVQENYIHARAYIQGLADAPSNRKLVAMARNMPNGQQVLNDVLTMQQLSEAADCISLGDVLNDNIFTEQDYSLMPPHAMLSTVIPAYIMRGGMNERINFPGALGKQSSRNKFLRIAKEFRIALSMDVQVSNTDIILSVLPLLRQEMLNALTEDHEHGIERVVAMLDSFGLDKDEFDQIMEWHEKFQPEESRYAAAVPSDVKRKLTTAWKQASHLRKVSRGGKADAGDVSRVRAGAAFKETTDDLDDDAEDGGGEDDEEGEAGSDAEAKAIIAAAAVTAKGKPKAAARKPAAAKKPAAPGDKPKKPRAPRKPKAEGAAPPKKRAKKKDSDDDESEDDF